MPKKDTSKKKLRRLRKQKKRDQHDRQRDSIKKMRHALNEWKPIVLIDKTKGNQEFIAAVETILKQLPFQSQCLFPRATRTLYQSFRNGGINGVLQQLSSQSLEEEYTHIQVQEFLLHLGTVVLEQMSIQQKEQFLPYNDLLITPENKSFRIQFSMLRNTRINGDPLIYQGKPCFYSPHMPTVNINGVGKIVAFTPHAIERVCQRIAPYWQTYGGLGDAYCYFSDCQYFELAKIRNGSESALAISFYQDCFLDSYRKTTFREPDQMFLRVIDPKPEHLDRHWYYRVGYCPIEVYGEFIIAKTVLPPGFTATPEYQLLRDSSMNKTKKQDLLERARSQQFGQALSTDFELVKWFHDNGIPQVCDLPGEIFAPAHGRKRKSNRPIPCESRDSDFYGIRGEFFG